MRDLILNLWVTTNISTSIKGFKNTGVLMPMESPFNPVNLALRNDCELLFALIVGDAN